MSTRIKLLAGVPNDDNRDYLPDAIKGTDMTVNETGNSSHRYPERLVERHAVLNGVEGTWYEYVPTTYDPSKKTPLVIGNHGGLMTGWGHAIYTSWVLVAERDGFICVFPDAHTKGMWVIESAGSGRSAKKDKDGNPVPNIDIKDNPDCNFELGLIDLMKKEYNIDEGRIFMQGMSAGNLFTHQFCRYYGHLLAGAAGASGPGSIKLCFDEKDGTLINRGGPLAIWQTRAEHNGFNVRDYEVDAYVNKYNRFYWMLINECDPIPQIKLDGEDNYAFYKGKKAPLVYLDVKNRDHGQTLDEAYLYWDYLFSGIHREPDGTIVQSETVLPQTGDAYAAAFTPGVRKAWFHNEIREMDSTCVLWQKLKYHGLNGGAKVRGEYFMVPLSFVAQMVDAQYKPDKEGHTAVLTLKDGRDLQFARGVIGCMIDDTLRSMYVETIEREDELLISVEWFFRYIMQMQVSVCNGVVYVTDHHAELSYMMADLIKDLLNDKAMPEKYPEDYTNLMETGW